MEFDIRCTDLSLEPACFSVRSGSRINSQAISTRCQTFPIVTTSWHLPLTEGSERTPHNRKNVFA